MVAVDGEVAKLQYPEKKSDVYRAKRSLHSGSRGFRLCGMLPNGAGALQ
jgi:hypothetical protein